MSLSVIWNGMNGIQFLKTIYNDKNPQNFMGRQGRNEPIQGYDGICCTKRLFALLRTWDSTVQETGHYTVHQFDSREAVWYNTEELDREWRHSKYYGVETE